MGCCHRYDSLFVVLFSVILALCFYGKNTVICILFDFGLDHRNFHNTHLLIASCHCSTDRIFSENFLPFSVFSDHSNYSSDMDLYFTDVWREMKPVISLKDRIEISSFLMYSLMQALQNKIYCA
jgi:hypothetical protein